jgi:hypothetical protein
MKDMVWLAYPIPATAKPQLRHDWPLDLTAATSNTTDAEIGIILNFIFRFY